jgi:heptaprenyl diphosphate synthase
MAVMVVAKRSKRFSVIGVSVLGGVFHNVGQILVAMVVLETASLIYYFPVLLVAGILAGVAIGVLGGLVTKRIAKLFA